MEDVEAVICVNRYKKATSGGPEAEAPLEEKSVGEPETPGVDESLSSEDEELLQNDVSKEELEGYQEIFEALSSEEESKKLEEQGVCDKEDVEKEEDDKEEDKEEAEEEEEEEEKEEDEKVEEEREEQVRKVDDKEEEDVKVRGDPEAEEEATSVVAEVEDETMGEEVVEEDVLQVDQPDQVEALESSESEGNDLDLDTYEISDDDDEDMEPVDVSDAESDFDFDDFDGEDDFEDELDLEDYEEEDDLGALKQGFNTWLACWEEELPQRLAQPGAAQDLRERLLKTLQKETGRSSAVDANRFSLQWEHALVFNDCPPLLGFVSKKDANALLRCENLKDLQLGFAWSENDGPNREAEVDTEVVVDSPSPAPTPSRPSREIRMDRSRSRDSQRCQGDKHWDRMHSSKYFDGEKMEKIHLRFVPLRKAKKEEEPWGKDIMSFPEERPKVTLDKDGVLVVYKPAFWTMTTSDKGDVEPIISRHSALQDWIRSHMGFRYKWLRQNDRAGLIHRLDVQTSGPIICGSNPKAFNSLRMSLHTHKFYKEYIALMHGALPLRECCGEMNYPLLTMRERGYAGWRTCVDPRGQEALTRYEAVAAYKYSEGHGKTQRYTLVRLHLITGKTHQIRVHLMELARRNNLKTHGIVGDYKYLPPRNLKLDKRICRRVFLHCYRLHFPMPGHEDDVCKVRCPLPVELQEALKQIDLDKDLTENYRKRCRKSRVMDRDDVIDKSCQQTRKYLNIPGLIDYDFWREQHN
ncbi:unnamed protein product [Durusdinium trenchii]|uniref:Pseudouridine synthase RsuA/RluA-like domain-containing protein n=1 Tax=Durusdinium trenchii TaxID=1381693 RepID=A0ABP0KCY0_9DINO